MPGDRDQRHDRLARPHGPREDVVDDRTEKATARASVAVPKQEDGDSRDASGGTNGPQGTGRPRPNVQVTDQPSHVLDPGDIGGAGWQQSSDGPEEPDQQDVPEGC